MRGNTLCLPKAVRRKERERERVKLLENQLLPAFVYDDPELFARAENSPLPLLSYSLVYIPILFFAGVEKFNEYIEEIRCG